MTNKPPTCPLCIGTRVEQIRTQDQRVYYLCQKCALIHLVSSQHPKPEDELARYLEHHNSLKNQGYVNFLMEAINPSLTYLQPGMKALDFGCGPTPVLSQILKRDFGTDCENYDPFFYPDQPSDPYDFIFSTEAFEHFFIPGDMLDKISGMLNKGGYLCIMTHLWNALENFERWWYRRDPTHVCFYHQHTLGYICEKWMFDVRYQDHKRVFVLQKL